MNAKPVDAATIRAWWWTRQGLDRSLVGAAPEAVLQRSGWARSVGGVSPYLTLFSRAGITRTVADEAVAAADIHELPAARGCTYVVPSEDYALSLRVAAAAGDPEVKTALKLGVTEEELERVCEAVLGALSKNAKDPEDLRAELGGIVRSLGEAGKKKGVTTTIPVALGMLQLRGEIRRVPSNGRFDQQRYRYALWRPNPLKGLRLTDEEAFTRLAEKYLRWIGPVTLEEVCWFTGMGKRVGASILRSLGAVPIAEGDPRVMLPADLDALRSHEPSGEPAFALVGSIDAMTAHRRDAKALLDEADRAHPLLTEGAAFADLTSHAILDRGRLVGLWEFDPAESVIVAATFDRKLLRHPQLREAIAHTERFVRDELGDARAFSLDSPKSRAPRLAALRAAAG